MDLNCKGISWVGNIYQKFEVMFLEVDEIMCQEPVKYVENQLKSVGVNVKQFCSELMQDVLPPSSKDSVKVAAPDLSLVENSDFVACKMSKVNINEDPTMELGNVNRLPHPSSVDFIKEDHFDSSMEQIVDIGMYEKSKVGVKENLIKEKPCQSEMSEVVDLVENDPSMASFVCGVHHANCDKEWDSKAQMSHPISVEPTRCKSSSKAGEISGDIVDASVDFSSTLPSSNSVILVESCECKLPDISLPPLGDALLTESIERTDGSIAEGAKRNDLTNPGIETIQPFDNVKLDESCIMVDSSELYSLSLRAGKHRSYKKKLQQAFASRMRLVKKQESEQQATWYENLDAGSSLQKERSFSSSTLIINSESQNKDFCESEWEII